MANEQAAAGVRVDVHGRGQAQVETGLPVLNRLLVVLAKVARFDLAIDIQPGDAEAEVDAAAAALGAALAGPLRVGDVRGYGSEALTSAEALASVTLETSDEPLFVTNVDLTEARIGGLGTDVARRFLETFAEHAGLVLHVRLLNGTDSAHVLEAIFKALGAALAQACEPIGGNG
jgi:imidazoleglycerol-phosphate dehydratase